MNISGRLLKGTIVIIIALAAAISLSFMGCKSGEAGDELTLYVWEGYLPESVILISISAVAPR